jgi:hypothetical protein
MAKIHSTMFKTNTENHQIKPIGAWDIEEVIRTSPRHGYYSKAMEDIYIPVDKKVYHCHKAFNIRQTSSRYHPNQIKGRTRVLPNDAIPASSGFVQISRIGVFQICIALAQAKSAKANDTMKWK